MALYWTTGSGRIELLLTADQASMGCHQGACDDDVAFLRSDPEIAKQLDALDADLVKRELREYGAWDDGAWDDDAWDDDALSDHDANLSRLLWLACGDIDEHPEDYR